jgi:hypothetical protein
MKESSQGRNCVRIPESISQQPARSVPSPVYHLNNTPSPHIYFQNLADNFWITPRNPKSAKKHRRFLRVSMHVENGIRYKRRFDRGPHSVDAHNRSPVKDGRNQRGDAGRLASFNRGALSAVKRRKRVAQK